MGILGWKFISELPSVDVAVTHAACGFVSRAGVWASPDESFAPGCGRGAAVSVVRGGDWRSDEKRRGGIAVRSASVERGGSGLGGGAENSTLHVFFPGRELCICLAREKTGHWTIRGGCGVVCAGTAVQSDGGIAAACAAGDGLLAASADEPRAGRRVRLESSVETRR